MAGLSSGGFNSPFQPRQILAVKQRDETRRGRVVGGPDGNGQDKQRHRSIEDNGNSHDTLLAKEGGEARKDGNLGQDPHKRWCRQSILPRK